MIIRATKSSDIESTRALVGRLFDARHIDLIDRLRAAGDVAIDLVALIDGAVAGHIVLSRMQSPLVCLGLGPLCVESKHQKRGLGGALVTKSIDQARADGWLAIFVLGAPGYYGRFGFSVAAAERFQTHYPKHAFMVLELQDGVCARLPREITYAQAFFDVGV